MKKLLLTLFALVLVASLSVGALGEELVDTYSSASTTKTTLAGEEYAKAIAFLAANGADLATLAESKKEGYTAPEGLNAQIMSVNPDGSVGLSTISQWKHIDGKGEDQIIIELTYGQNALNLAKENARGSLLISSDVTYLVHCAVLSVDEQVYTDAAFEAGEFNAHYSGAPMQLSSFTITMKVLSIETSRAILL